MERFVERLAGVGLLGLVACAGGAAIPGAASKPSVGGDAARVALVAKIDSIVSAPIVAGKVVGASIAVVKGRDTIAVQGFGKANIELDVATGPHAIYEIGSVTKQFTGAAIMQLVEQGKVNLDDDISKYLPNVSTQGRKIPVRRLLDHTSGIKGYTEMPEFRDLMASRRPIDTLLKLISKKPHDFEPGVEEIYNNSAFFLAGLIIEKASGMPYDQYVQKNLFDKAGMKDAHYCSETKIHKGKVSGYDSDSAGPVLKAPLSHVWPYAAGSLCSSAIDLVRWNEALHRDGTILGAEAYKEYIKPSQLADGTVLGYAKGLAVYNRVGHRALHHGGGINGFLSENIYFPDDSLSVIVLFNTAGPGSPDAAATAIAEAVLGKTPEVDQPIDGDINRFAGTYAGKGRGQPTEITISAVDGKLMAKAAALGDSARALTYRGDRVFAREDTRFVFGEQGGKITTLRIDAGYGNNLLKRK